MNREDRRFKKTEKALSRALSELLEEKPLFKITIDELVERADLHRSTFYTHYQDIFELYDSLKKTFFDMLKEAAKENSHHDYLAQYAFFVDFLMENKQLARLFLGKNTDPEISSQLETFLTERILSISAFEEQITEIPANWYYLSAYHAGGMIAIIKYWVLNDFHYDKKDLLDQLEKLDRAFDSAF